MPTPTNLNTANRFRSIHIDYDSRRKAIQNIGVYIDGDADLYASVRFPDVGEPVGDSLANLNVLRDHYADNGGFLRDDGTLIQVTISNQWVLGTTMESFAQFGLYNPFDPDGWENYLQSLEDDGDYSRGEKRRRVSDSGLITQEVHGVQPMKRRSDEANTGVSLERVEASQSGTKINFTITIPYGEQITADGLDDYPEVMAFVEWIRDQQPDSETDFASDVSADASFENRTVVFRQDPDDSTSEITLSFDEVILIGQTPPGESTFYIDFLRIKFTRDSGAAISPSDLSGFFEDVSVLLPSSDEVTEEPTWGSLDVRTRTKGIIFPDGAEITYESGKYWKKVRNANGTFVYIPLQEGSGETLHYEQMPTLPNGRHLIPDFTSPYSAVHFDGSDVGAVFFREPSVMVRSPETHTSWIVHNRSALYDLDLFDFNNQLFAVLLPGQLAIVQMSLHANGNGELSVQRMPTRSYIKQQGSQSFNNRPNWASGSFYYVLLPMPTTTVGASYDAFTFTTITRSISGANIDTYPDANFNFKEGVTVKYSGNLRILASWNLVASSSGGIANYNGIRIWCKRGTDNPINVGTNSLPPLVAGDERTYNLPATWKARVDDFIFFTHRYVSLTGTISVPQLRVEIDQDPNITILHEAS